MKLHINKPGRYQRDAIVSRKCFSKKNHEQLVIDTHDIENDILTDITLQSSPKFCYHGNIFIMLVVLQENRVTSSFVNIHPSLRN